MSSVEFGVLGPVTVTADGAPLNIGGPKQQTVLAMLVAHAREQVLASTLVHAAYGEDAEPNAKRRIQVYVSTLRGEIGDRIVKFGQGWKLDVPNDAIDAGRFEEMYRAARDLIEESPEAAAELLRESLSIWRGHPYTGVDDHGLLDGEVRRLTQLRFAGIGARIDADLACGRHSELIGEIEALIAENPYVESLRAQHMLALYRAGRQREALRSFEDMRNILIEELGVDPTKELQDLEQRILNQADTLDLSPRTTIRKKAILVVDAGDPLEMTRMAQRDREAFLEATSRALDKVSEGGSATWVHSGLASFTSFDSTADAAQAAQDLHLRLGSEQVRMAIDFGEVELADGVLTGAPVSRGAVLAAAAHPGQVILSSEAQQAFVAGGEGQGKRFELLGSYQLIGLQEPVPVFQLLTTDPPIEYPPLLSDRIPPPVPGSSVRSVPGYELREQVGPGSVGILHRAYQPSAGREVLVEVIPASISSQTDFVRRFEADAQRLSFFDHPHINSPIDYWRDPDGAYLVYRYHRGGFLESARANERRLIEQIGSALAYAHAYGVVHGSVRPDRVMLDESGNASLLGFRVAGVEPESSTDFAAYIAPEALLGNPPTPATDIYGLAVLAAEQIEGPSAQDRPLSPADPVLAKAVADDPGQRYSSMVAFLDELFPQSVDAPSARLTQLRNPYKGLSAFHEADAADFHGRTELVAELVAHLATSHLLAVVGPSGVGKSSVVRAGLIPELRSGFVPGSEEWVITDMLPGPRPFLELERALERVAIDLPPPVRERFADRDPNAFAGLDSVLPPGARLLVVVDQFEELFTITERSVASDFLDLLVTVAKMNQARVVLTLRADFLGEPLLYSEFGDLIGDNLITVPAPSPSEIAEAIEGPAQGVGLAVDPALVERIVGDVHDRPGALPLLQHALVEVFAARTSDQLGIEDYEGVWGVEGSLARRAETTFGRLDSTQGRAVEQVFLRLVSVVDESAPTRRRVRFADLEDLDTDGAVDAFIKARLLVTDTDPDTRAPTIEVAHEALLAHWPRLAGWIEDVREDLMLSRRIDEAIRDWEANGEDDAYLLAGGRLAQHEAWMADTSLVLAERQTTFLSNSADREARSRRRRRRRRQAITAGFAAAAVVAGMFGLFALDNASIARSEALAASAVSELETDPELAVLLGIKALELNPTSPPSLTALNQALQVHRAEFRLSGPTIGSISPAGTMLVASTHAETGVWEVGQTTDEPLWRWPVWDDHFIGESYFSSDSTKVIVVSVASGGKCSFDRFTVLDARTGEVWRDHDLVDLNTYWGGPAQNGPFVDLSRPLILGAGGGADCQGNPTEGDLVAADLWTGDVTPLVWGASPKGRSFVGVPTMSEDGTILAWTGNTGGAVIDLTSDQEFPLPPGFSTLSPNGSVVLTGNDPLELWDVDERRKLREFKAEFASAWFSPSGSMIYGATADGRVVVYDAEFGDLLFELKGRGSDAIRVQMTHDENLIATSGPDGMAVWDIASTVHPTARPAQFYAIQEDELAFFAIQNSLVTDDYLVAGRVVLANERALFEDQPSTPAYDLTTVFDLETGAAINTYPGLALAVSPDGATLALQGSGGLVDLTEEETEGQAPPGTYLQTEGIVIADLRSGRTIKELAGLCPWYDGPSASPDKVVPSECPGYPDAWADFVNHARFSPDGSLLAMAGETSRFAVWDVATGRMIWSQDTRIQGDASFLFLDGGVAFSSDGRYLLTSVFTGTRGLGAPATIEVRDVEEQFVVVHEFETLVEGTSRMEFTPDGRWLVMNDQGPNVFVVDTNDWTTVHTLRSGQRGGFLPDIAVDPTGRLAATAGRDGVSVVWDIVTGQEVQRFDFSGTPLGLRNVEWVDAQTLILGSRFWAIPMTVDTDALLDHARGRLTRTFTQSECNTYAIDPCPTLEEMRSG